MTQSTMTKITTTTKTLADQQKKYCRIILTQDKLSWHRLVETTDGHLEYRMGAGKRNETTVRTFRTLIRSIVHTAKIHQLERIAIHLGPMGLPKIEEKGEEWFFRTLAENLSLAQYEFTHYKTKKNSEKKLEEILVCGINTKTQKDAFSTGLIIGEAANFTRDISNTSGDDMTPSLLAKAAEGALKDTAAAVMIHNRKAIVKLKMGLLEAVGKGATDPANLIVIEYWGAG
jgi:leucyl aminopeptidase